MSDLHPTSRALREGFERDYVLPLARAMFELAPGCQSVLVTVGQYWCDEATDAVHSHELACDERDPVWPRAGQVHLGAIGNASEIEELVRDAEAHAGQDDYIAGLAEVQYSLWEAARRQAFGDGHFATLDENREMIVAFASYCREVSDQEQSSWRSHTPYCLVRRQGPGVPLTTELVGTMHRPEWEDRWDVLDQDGIISGVEQPARPESEEALLHEARPARRNVVLVCLVAVICLVAITVLLMLRGA